MRTVSPNSLCSNRCRLLALWRRGRHARRRQLHTLHHTCHRPQTQIRAKCLNCAIWTFYFGQRFYPCAISRIVCSHPLVQFYILLFSFCCGNSICHSRESGNPAFSFWTPAYAGVISSVFVFRERYYLFDLTANVLGYIDCRKFVIIIRK